MNNPVISLKIGHRWHYVLLVATILVGLLAAGLSIYNKWRNDIIVQIDGKTQAVSTFARTVGEVLDQQGIVLQPKDIVLPSQEEPLADGTVIAIWKAFPVEVTADGDTTRVVTTSTSVGGLLEDLGIGLSATDRASLPMEMAVFPGVKIEVTRVTNRIFQQTRTIPSQVVRQYDDRLEKGIRRVAQSGAEGKEEISIKVNYENGQEVSREIVAKKVIKQALDRIIAMGTISYASRGGQTFNFERAIEVLATAYTYTGNKTATGIQPRVGIVAVDRNVIPLGTKLYVEGYGFARAMDVGSGIKGNHIDVFLESEQEARRWGRKNTKVYVLK
ncbi:MAG: ubiquitin-like domain-containing protein [Bacillota bacterium]